MTIVCPTCQGDKFVVGRVPFTFDGKQEVTDGQVACKCCRGMGTITADKNQIKAEGRRMKAARIKRNQMDTGREANRYDVLERDYIRFEQGKPVSEDVMRKLGAKP